MSDAMQDRYRASLAEADWAALRKISDRPRKLTAASAAMLVGAGYAIKWLKGSVKITPEGLVALQGHR